MLRNIITKRFGDLSNWEATTVLYGVAYAALAGIRATSEKARLPLVSMQKSGLDTDTELIGGLTWCGFGNYTEISEAQTRIPSPQFSKRWKKLDAR